MASITDIDATCAYEGAEAPAVAALNLEVADGGAVDGAHLFDRDSGLRVG